VESLIKFARIAERPHAILGGMWNLSLPWWEFIVRGIIVYASCYSSFASPASGRSAARAVRSRAAARLSNAVQNAMNGGRQFHAAD